VNGWEIAGFAMLVGGLAPALVLASRGDAIERLVGMELASSVGLLTLLVVIQGNGQPGYLIVPLVLVLLAFAGTLVFIRLLGTRP
jgi:multisubunit Na+/H+ antiporter MnhF subunit